MSFFLIINNKISKTYPFFFVFLFAILCSCSAPQKKAGIYDPYGIFSKPGTISALVIAVDTVAVSLDKGTPSSVLASLNDSFFLETANALLQYEASKRFSVSAAPVPGNPGTEQDSSEIRELAVLRATRSGTVTASVDSIAKVLAAHSSVDLVVLPYECALKETLERPAGWRGDKYGQSYERPYTSTAKVLFGLRIWDRNGRLVFDRKGTGSCRQPVLYSLFKQGKKGSEDMVSYSKKYFAPPLIRALSSAVSDAFPQRP